MSIVLAGLPCEPFTGSLSPWLISFPLKWFVSPHQRFLFTLFPLCLAPSSQCPLRRPFPSRPTRAPSHSLSLSLSPALTNYLFSYSNGGDLPNAIYLAFASFLQWLLLLFLMAIVLQIATSALRAAATCSWVVLAAVSGSVGHNCVCPVRKQQQAGQILQVLVPAGRHRNGCSQLTAHCPVPFAT